MRRLAPALAFAVGCAAAAATAATVEVTVHGMGIDPVTGSPVVRLVEKAKAGRELPIWIGPFEAQAIAIEMRGIPPPRPLTHDLMKVLVERLGGTLNRVVIEDLRDNTYFATLHLAGADRKALVVDARPSDAIALALRLHRPILVTEDLFTRASAARPSPAAVRLWGLTLQDLTPEIAAFFEVDTERGVLVSDVAATAAAHELLRGDVITALDDRPVGSVEELASRAGARSGDEPVRLSVRRGRREVSVSFAAEPPPR
jgi:bifunctional DNase/RNase